MEFNKKYLVRDKEMTVSQIYSVWFEPYEDCYLVHDELYNECYILDMEEILDTFEFLN